MEMVLNILITLKQLNFITVYLIKVRVFYYIILSNWVRFFCPYSEMRTSWFAYKSALRICLSQQAVTLRILKKPSCLHATALRQCKWSLYYVWNETNGSLNLSKLAFNKQITASVDEGRDIFRLKLFRAGDY